MPVAVHKWTIVKLFLVALNVASTALTLFTGLRENPVLVLVSGRYDPIRARLRDGSINTEIAQDDVYRVDKLMPLADVASDFRFITAPRRDPSTIGEYRSVCTNINSNNASVLGLVYDDFWGKGARRVQIFVYSISAPKCKVFNAKPKWRDRCYADHGNASACHRYVIDNFETLQKNRLIQVGTNKDFGEKGVPFLKCLGRPYEPFDFQADLVAHQSYWSGGSYHIMIQTSDCRAEPLIRNADHEWGLFQVHGVDEGADVLLALPPAGWFTSVVTAVYSVVTLVMIAMGIVAALFHKRTVQYLPEEVRYSRDRRLARYLVPFMPAAIFLSENDRAVITFKGSLLVASDIWMNHWLYMSLSILDAISNLRLTYVTLQVGTWMLIMKVTFENFLFLCSALTKITWIMCLVHTLLRFFLKLMVRSLRAMRIIKAGQREKMEWHIDGSAMFLSYKVYNLLLCLILFIMLKYRGSPSFMERADPYKVGMYGGIPKIARFWNSELVCDLLTLLALLTVCGQFIGFALLCTRYRLVADNSVMRLLQQRYIIAGWDGLMAASMLGLEPNDPDFLVEGLGRTKFCIGSLLQLLYLSGPSSFVHLGGDYIFAGNGFTRDPVKFRYPVVKAMSMGLIQGNKGSVYSRGTGTDSSGTMRTLAASQRMPTHPTIRETGNSHSQVLKRSIFERGMSVVSEGHFGKVLFVDDAQPGVLATNKETGMREFVLMDALATISILDIKWLLGNEKKLRSA